MDRKTIRRSTICAVLLLITIPIGLAVRFLPLGLPWFLYKYLGSRPLGRCALLVPRRNPSQSSVQ